MSARDPLRSVDPVDQILHLFATRGDNHYGEDVSQREHAEQCAYHAREDGADDTLIIAALLHDIGHFLHKQGEDAADHGIDTQHERIGAGWLARILPPSVTEPIALHVAAKRYLATVDPTYLQALSAASLQSFMLQGGLMDADETAAFEAHPAFERALQLRRYDEIGKLTGVEMPAFDSYAPLIRALLAEKAV